jgi:hypothetical protein
VRGDNVLVGPAQARPVYGLAADFVVEPVPSQLVQIVALPATPEAARPHIT